MGEEVGVVWRESSRVTRSTLLLARAPGDAKQNSPVFPAARARRYFCTNLLSDCVSASDAGARDVAPHTLNGVQGVCFLFCFLPDLAEQRDPVNAGAENPPCSGRGLRSGSQLCSCAGPWLSTPATSVAGEEGEEDEGK